MGNRDKRKKNNTVVVPVRQGRGQAALEAMPATGKELLKASNINFRCPFLSLYFWDRASSRRTAHPPPWLPGLVPTVSDAPIS